MNDGRHNVAYRKLGKLCPYSRSWWQRHGSLLDLDSASIDWSRTKHVHTKYYEDSETTCRTQLCLIFAIPVEEEDDGGIEEDDDGGIEEDDDGGIEEKDDGGMEEEDGGGIDDDEHDDDDGRHCFYDY